MEFPFQSRTLYATAEDFGDEFAQGSDWFEQAVK